MNLGNIEFLEDKQNGNDICILNSSDPISAAAVQTVCQLLKVERDMLQNMLCQVIVYKPESKSKGWTPKSSTEECRKLRDTLAKVLYDTLFDKLLTQINQQLGAYQHLDETMDTRARTGRFINILDIFGFEIFPNNSFEQLCINFTNERLQGQFNRLMIQKEIEEMEREGLKLEIQYDNNDHLIRLIGGDPKGNKATEASVFKTISDKGRIDCKPEALMEAILSTVDLVKFPGNDPGGIQASMKTRVRRAPKESQKFVIKHFAGDVVYNTEQLIEKNKKANIEGFAKVLSESSCEYIRDMFLDPRTAEAAKDQSEGGDYLLQLDRLINTLEETSVTYIRCIRANEKNVPDKFASQLVHQQLTNSGVFQATEIREKGYPIRRDYADMLKVYRPLYVFYRAGGEPRVATQGLVDALIKWKKIAPQNPEKPEIFLSARRAMMKDTVKTVLDRQLEEIILPRVITIQKAWKLSRGRLMLTKLRLYVIWVKLCRSITSYQQGLAADRWIRGIFAKRRQARMRKELMRSQSKGQKDLVLPQVETQETLSSEGHESSPMRLAGSRLAVPPRPGGSVPSRREALLQKMREMMRPGAEFETPDMSHIELAQDLDCTEDPRITLLTSKIQTLQSEVSAKNEELIETTVSYKVHTRRPFCRLGRSWRA